jgi:hypothetical protein
VGLEVGVELLVDGVGCASEESKVVGLNPEEESPGFFFEGVACWKQYE